MVAHHPFFIRSNIVHSTYAPCAMGHAPCTTTNDGQMDVIEWAMQEKGVSLAKTVDDDAVLSADEINFADDD